MNKVAHRAAHVNEKGWVSALCSVKSRKIDLAVATWTIVDERVTCEKCRRLIRKAAKTYDWATGPVVTTTFTDEYLRKRPEVARQLMSV